MKSNTILLYQYVLTFCLIIKSNEWLVKHSTTFHCVHCTIKPFRHIKISDQSNKEWKSNEQILSICPNDQVQHSILQTKIWAQNYPFLKIKKNKLLKKITGTPK